MNILAVKTQFQNKTHSGTSNFQPITTPNLHRLTKKPSKLLEHVEKDRKSKRKEIDGVKMDPFNLLQPEDIEEYAAIGLEMFQQSLALCSSDSNYSTVLRNIERLDLGQYVDDVFPPCLKSLVGDELMTRAPWRAFVWLQAEQFCETASICNYDDDTGYYSPDEVRQGLLGDGYLIAVLSSLANDSSRIEKCFSMTAEQGMMGKEHGVCAVKLYHAGKPIEVIIDDYYPCISAEVGPAFAKCLGYLWPMMIEKAFAKLFYSYSNIEKSTPASSFRDITGAPAKSLYTDELPDKLWGELCIASKYKWPMTACTYDFKKGIDYIDPENGLISDHTYSCLGGFYINKVKLVKLRTVVSEAKWKGKWSLASNEENKEWEFMTDKQNYLDELEKQEFLFFMEFNEFIQHFESVQFCYMDNNYKYSFNSAKLTKKHGHYFKISFTEPGKYCFTVSQEDLRNYPKSYSEKYDYANVTLAIGKVNEKKEVKYIDSNMFAKRDLFCTPEKDLIPGEYVAYVKVLWPTGDENTATISVYGPGECSIEEKYNFEYANLGNTDSFLENLWLDYAENHRKVQKISLASEGAINSEYCVERTLHGYAYIAVWNKEENQKISCEFRVKQMKESDMKLKASFCGKEIAVFELPPGRSKIVLIRCKKYELFKIEFFLFMLFFIV